MARLKGSKGRKNRDAPPWSTVVRMQVALCEGWIARGTPREEAYAQMYATSMPTTGWIKARTAPEILEVGIMAVKGAIPERIALETGRPVETIVAWLRIVEADNVWSATFYRTSGWRDFYSEGHATLLLWMAKHPEWRRLGD